MGYKRQGTNDNGKVERVLSRRIKAEVMLTSVKISIQSWLLRPNKLNLALYLAQALNTRKLSEIIINEL